MILCVFDLDLCKLCTTFLPKIHLCNPSKRISTRIGSYHAEQCTARGVEIHPEAISRDKVPTFFS